jgi:hypothetical protein
MDNIFKNIIYIDLRILSLYIFIMNETIKLTQHPGQGFFSCCTVILENIIKYFNINKKLPDTIDNVNMFTKYNPFPPR